MHTPQSTICNHKSYIPWPFEEPATRGRTRFSMLQKKSRAITDPALAFRLDYLCHVREIPLKPSLINAPYR